MFIDFESLNVVAILVGGLIYMAFGGIYYSSLLSKKNTKNRENSERQMEGQVKYLVAVAVAFISSLFMAGLVDATGIEGLGQGLLTGLSVGAIISLVYLKNSLFGLVSKKALLIAIGDHLIAFSLLGALHGIWM